MSSPKLVIVGVVLVLVVYCLRGTYGGESDTESHVFTSHANLLKLYYIEEECLGSVDVFLREELLKHEGDEAGVDAAHNLSSVRRLVTEAKKIHKEVGSDVEAYVSHPINVFHLTRRLYNGWKNAIDLIRESKACREWHIPQVISRLANMERNLPTIHDVTSMAHSLVTIQHTQGIRTGDFLKGLVGQHRSLAPLTPQEQFLVAKEAVEEDDYYYAAQWLKHLSKSPKLAEMRRERDGFNATNVLGMLASALFRINMVPEALKITNELLKKDPHNVVARTNKVFFEERMAKKKDRANEGRPKRYGKEDVYRRNFEALCRGTNIKPSRMKCRLEPAWPRSKISFYKMEVLRRKPPIVVFHDVISRSDANHIVNISNKQYEDSAIDPDEGFQTPDFTLVLSEVRPADSTWRSTQTHKRNQKLVKKIATRLQALPSMAIRPYISGESEARNFGHQGFYVKPNPAFEIQTMGGHTGTVMMFLNDVEMGGEIVFPSAKVRVEPEVGKLVFYYPSLRKFHSVCPVAYGTEWVLAHTFFEKRASGWCRPHEDPDLL